MKKAIIQKGEVVQVVDASFKAASNAQFVDCDETVITGDKYEDGKFIKPPKLQRPTDKEFIPIWYSTKSESLVYFDGKEVIEVGLHCIKGENIIKIPVKAAGKPKKQGK